MILTGLLLSPFVRRVQVSLNLLGIDYQRNALSTATDGDAIDRLNPLRRVPALEIEDGEVLIDSTAILDYLDDMVGPLRALVPASGDERRKVLRLLALAVGAAEKAVTAHYEKNRRPQDKFWDTWFDKCCDQVRGGMAALEAAAPADGGWLAGGAMSQADITTAVSYDFINVVLPEVLDERDYPRLQALVARMNDIEGFAATHPSME